LALVNEKKFRQDLLYRINTITIEIPPLRERRDDIMILAEHFLNTFSKDRAKPRLAVETIDALISYDWPGNVRELRNVMERCCILSPGEKIEFTMLPPEIQRYWSENAASREAAHLVEKEQIRRALSKHKWNQSRASRELNIPLSTLRRKIKKYQITKSV
jgi:DNA-binding NtrC family response regulator